MSSLKFSSLLFAWFIIWAWNVAYFEEDLDSINPFLASESAESASKEFLEKKHREIIRLLNQNYAWYIVGRSWPCDLTISGQTRKKIIITLECQGILVMPHVETNQISNGNFQTFVKDVWIEKDGYNHGNCITIKNPRLTGTTCKSENDDWITWATKW